MRQARAIFFFVLLVHVALVLPFFLKKQTQPLKIPIKKIHVETITLLPSSPPPQEKIAAALQPPEKPPLAPSKPKPKPKAAPAAQKKEKPVIKPEKTQKKKELLAALEKSLKQCDLPKKQTSSKRETLPTLSFESQTPEDASYLQKLGSYLQELLILPEKGRVKLKLTLSPDGTIVDLAILFSESSLNQEYIQAKLPVLALPSFNEKRDKVITLNLEGKE